MKNLEDTLKETGLPYKKNGDWGLSLMPIQGSNRAHAYNIHFTGEEEGGFRYHQIRCAIGPVGDGSNLRKICEILSQQNRGSIGVSNGDIWLKWTVPTGISAKTLTWQLYGAAQTADEIEKEVFKGADKE